MATQNVESVLSTAAPLSVDELMEAAERLMVRARGKATEPRIDVNALAGTLVLDEDPMVIQERMRWE